MKAIHMLAARARTRERELRQIAAHDERMQQCLVCRQAQPRGCLCPDCYVCSNCGPKCDECADIPRA